MPRLRCLSTTAGLLLVANAKPLLAQCPDGSAPPCGSRTVAAVTRRPDPALDDRTWIVVPFDNLNGNQEVDWLRSGSVNLLYMSMSRWTDLRVIDDERVGDYLREVPGAAAARQLSLAQGIAIAKRAGAGRLVMGDILKLGATTTVNAKIFDVRTGQRLRTVREEARLADSLMSMFGTLSRKVLNIAPPQGSATGATGTSSIAAYQAYAEGLQAFHRFDLDGAQRKFSRALEIDSTFALAHHKLAVVFGWVVASGQPSIREHAEAAARLSGPLPPREKALITASAAFARGDYLNACVGFRSLVGRDSTDTDAWYGLGDCLYHDLALEPIDSDSTRVRWRSSLNGSLHAFRQVLTLDPTYHLAYQHVVDAYSTPGRVSSFCVSGRCSQYTAVVLSSGDSLITTPVAVPRDTALLREHQVESVRRGARRILLTRAREVSELWIAANPSEGRAHLMHATVLASLGSVAAADSSLRRVVVVDSSNAGFSRLLLRLELAVKSWRGADAVRLYDSVRANSAPMPGTGGRITTGSIIVVVAPTFGRFTQYDSLVMVSLLQANVSPARERLSRSVVKTMMGAPLDSLPAVLRALHAEVNATGGSAAATRAVAPFMTLVMQESPMTWPAIDTTVRDLRVAPFVAILRSDTSALRAAARGLDSLSRTYMAALLPDTGLTLAAAGAYLALRDSANAVEMTRRWLDAIVPYTQMVQVTGRSTFVQPYTPRAMLLRADLAAGLGLTAEARLWYDRFIEFFDKADAEFQPLVERARRARRLLGGV